MGRKICLTGFSSYSREWANDQEDDVEIWGMNECHLFLNRWDRWYQIHPTDWEKERAIKRGFPGDCYGRPQVHVDFLAKCGVPVYQQALDPRIPTSTLYPYKEITEAFGWPLYLTSTLAYMSAHAALEHKQGKTIDTLTWAGIELIMGTEYFFQRACFEYYLGNLQGMGVKLIRPEPPYSSQVLADPVYGRDSKGPMGPIDIGEVMGWNKKAAV